MASIQDEIRQTIERILGRVDQNQSQQGFQVVPQRLSESFNNYTQSVQENKQNLPSPFFNNTGNNPVQWLGKVAQDTKKRGVFEGLQDLTNPIVQNRSIYPYVEPLISGARVKNYKMGRPNPLINAMLGQTDTQMNGENNPSEIKNYFINKLSGVR